MITIPRSEREAFQSSNPKNLTLNFPYRDPITNDGIYMESSKFEQSICEESNITFGAVYSSRFSVRIFDNGESYVGVRVNPRISVTDDNDRAYERSLGFYTVKSDKLTSDKLYRDLDCYDYLADVLPVDFHAWHNSRPSTFTMKQYRDAFFSYIQLEQVPITLPNDGITFTKMEMEKLSGADILSLILQLNGAFGFIGIDGRFKYVIPKTTPDYTIEDNSFVQGSLDYEDEPIKKISGIKLTGYSVEYGEEAQSYTIPDVLVGNENENVVTIEDNCLTHLVSPFARQVICENLYNSLKDYCYYPTKVKLPAYIGLEPGDVFQIVTDRKTITFPAFKRTLSGISMLMDEIEAQGETDIVINANSVGNGLSSVQVVLKQMQLSVTEMLAQKASIEAQDAAIAANIAANGALTQLSIVQDVAGTLNWIREHGTFVQTTDVVINPNTVYFVYENGEYTPIVAPDPNLNPSEEGWYVLDVTSSQSDYIMAHLAVTEAGLWVLPFNTLAPHPLVDSDDNVLIDSNNNHLVDWSKDPQYSTGYKVLLSNNGMTVYDSFGNSIANYGETTRIGAEMTKHVFIDNDSVDIKDGEDTLASFSGNGMTIYDSDGEIASFKRRADGSLQKATLNFPVGEQTTRLDAYEYSIDPWENESTGRQSADYYTGVYKSRYSHSGIYNNGSTLPVGYIDPQVEGDNTSTIPSGQWWQCQQFPMTEGVWLVTFGAGFSTNANGDRWLVFGTSNPPTIASVHDVIIPAAKNSYTIIQSARIIKVPYTSAGYVMYYLYAFQNSGSSLSVSPFVQAVKLV